MDVNAMCFVAGTLFDEANIDVVEDEASLEHEDRNDYEVAQAIKREDLEVEVDMEEPQADYFRQVPRQSSNAGVLSRKEQVQAPPPPQANGGPRRFKSPPPPI
ncbi:hypothetical protein LTR78_009163 [Recurvomyces mirabilis]|uniref:Uncharacterized protein n=1 Tax=Recurvomyces mirabilis TaxID=574656 RepID=A0AAE0WIJ3_9PEZI|nr:hypothetical protein LTR78_009163 [Recurvomyces mirabilis]KAK5155677.1 hypothetical protein LTS14_005938 [Recurvomyces mirabilis]